MIWLFHILAILFFIPALIITIPVHVIKIIGDLINYSNKKLIDRLKKIKNK